MDRPAISVVVPVYKVEDYLDRCVASIVSQTYDRLQIILVDDGSPDGCGAMCDAWAEKDSRITVIHKENGGVTSARLRGIEAAAGEYITFVDSDDYIEPDMYTRLLHNARAHDAQISHCGYRMVFPNRVDYYYNTGRFVVQEGIQGCADLLEAAYVEPGLWNKMYRRELFEGLSQWMDTSIRINEDVLMNYYLFRKATRAVYEDFCPYHYILRKNSASTSHLQPHRLADPVKVHQRIENETRDQPRLHALARRNHLYQLTITIATPTKNQRAVVLPQRKAAVRKLRKNLWGYLGDPRLPAKLKIMGLMAAAWPAGYCWIYALYAKIAGFDKKYSLD